MARIVRRTSTWAWRLRPRLSWPWVASRRLSWATTRWTAARSCSGPVGSARSSSVSGRLGGSDWVRSICARSSSRRRCASKRRIWSRVSFGSLVAGVLHRPAGLRAQPERAADPLHVDAEHAGALAAAAEGGDRQPREVAHGRLVAVADRLQQLLAQVVELDPLAAGDAVLGRPRGPRAGAPAASAARKKKRSNTRSKMRRSSGDLASVEASAARKSAGTVHGTSASAANVSLSSEVPIATPSARSASPNWRIRASKLTRPGGPRRARPPCRGRCGA